MTGAGGSGRLLFTGKQEAEIGAWREARPAEKRRAAVVLLACFSVMYFVDFCLRAAGKYFWFDELVTLYVCRLPSLHDIYEATLHGADYNPPLFHILTRLAEAPFGEGLIATRMPAMIGVWLLCVCLFAVVRKRAGTAAGAVAMLLPLVSSARFYAYEARATGIVLGLAGLAALAWQRLPEARHRKLWLGVFGASLLGAFLTHCYAITLLFPFGCAEAFRSWERRKLDVAPWAIMGCAALVALGFYVPLWHAFQQHVGAGFFPPTLGALQGFYIMLLAPATLALLACLTAWAVDRAVATSRRRAVVPGEDLVLALGFLLLPATGLVLAAVIHGPFIGRYWFPTIVGVCLAAGYGSDGRSKWMAPALAVLLGLLTAGDFARVVYHRMAGIGETLVEPNTLLPMNTTPGHPLRAYEGLWAHVPGEQPIVVTDGLEFAFLAHYGEERIRRRLFYLTTGDGDTVGGLLKGLQACCQVSYHLAKTGDFLGRTPHFYLYGKPREPLFPAAQTEARPGEARFGAFLGDHVVLEFGGLGVRAQ